MTKPILPRLGAACGAAFAIVLFVANGDGSHGFSAPRAVAGVAAITLAVPFICYLGARLRAAEGEGGWLALTAVGAGLTGITLKLSSGAPELTEHRAGVPSTGQLHQALDGIGGGLTLISLYPLAVFCTATAIVALRTRALPRWLGVGAAVTAVALAVNGADITTDVVPGLLLFLLWIAVTSVYLVVTAGREVPAPQRTRVAAPSV